MENGGQWPPIFFALSNVTSASKVICSIDQCGRVFCRRVVVIGAAGASAVGPPKDISDANTEMWRLFRRFVLKRAGF